MIFIQSRTPENKKLMSELALSLSKLYSSHCEEYLNKICFDVESSIGDHKAKLAWEAINKLSCRKSRSSGIISAEDNVDRLKKWFSHFKKLLSPSTKLVRASLRLKKVFKNLIFRTGSITLAELSDAVSSLQCNKAAGVDEDVSEILKCKDLSKSLLDVLNICYDLKTVPNEWHVSLLIPIYKKGDPSQCNNRGIALMSVCAKLYNRILLGRI
jgi:hypothetical protein